MSFTIISTNSWQQNYLLSAQSSKQENTAYGFGRQCAYFEILLPRIFSNNQKKQVSPIEKGDKMTV